MAETDDVKDCEPLWVFHQLGRTGGGGSVITVSVRCYDWEGDHHDPRWNQGSPDQSLQESNCEEVLVIYTVMRQTHWEGHC